MALLLLIDDEQAVRRIVARMLVRAGHEVVEADDGQAGLRALERLRPDLVITDMVMPNKEGIETIAGIRALTDAPILAVSGARPADGLDVLKDARMLGASATLAKPFSSEELLATINSLLAASGPAPGEGA